MFRARRSEAFRIGLPLALVLLAVAAPPALGHAAFLSSTPAAGARLEESPRTVELRFTEPLIGRITKATVSRVEMGDEIAGVTTSAQDERLVLTLPPNLAASAYRVTWHTVSTEDGHALEGSFDFGVRAEAGAGAQRLEKSPLAGTGLLRIATRGLFYGALIFFGGGLLTGILLSPGSRPAAWLVPQGGDPELAARTSERLWGRTVDIGFLALGSGAATVISDAADASSGLGLRGMAEYLLSNAAGLARVGTLLLLLCALVLAERRPAAAAGALVLSLLGLSIGGHANSSEIPAIAISTDWAHLVGGTVWMGGIAQLALAWWTLRRDPERELRASVMRDVLGAFGRVALPAFILVVGTGLVTAIVQVETLSALWQTPYGLVLSAKVGLVGLVGLASFVHAIRLRPRLLSASVPPGPPALERRHWRLVRSEPVIGVVVVLAAAMLVAFPLPPRQVADAGGREAEARGAGGPCSPCPQRAAAGDELAVAGQAGSSIVAAWVRRGDAGITGELRVLGADLEPIEEEVVVQGATQSPCGAGCWRFQAPATPVLTVTVKERGRRHSARLPVRWLAGEEARATRLLKRAERTMRALRFFRMQEAVTSGPGTSATIDYRFQAPDRLALRTDLKLSTVVIDRRRWQSRPGEGWIRVEGGQLPYRTRREFRWTPFADSVRLLGVRRLRGRRVGELAFFDRATPAWFRLQIELRSGRVLTSRIVTKSHFIEQRFFALGVPVSINAPADP